MAYPNKQVAEKISVPLALLFGLMTGWGITIVLAVLITFMIAGEKLQMGLLPSLAIGTMLLSAFAGAWTAAGKAQSKRLIICLCSGALYYLSLLCCNALFLNGTYQGLTAALATVMGACLIAGLLGLRQKNRKIPGVTRHRKW